MKARFAAFFLPFLILLACEDSATVSPNTCSMDSDCGSDQVCRYDFCVAPSSGPIDLGFRLVPPNTSTLQPQSIVPARVSPEENISIALLSSVRVAGRLLFVNDQNQVRADGPLGVLTFEKRGGLNPVVKQQRLDTDSRYDLYVLPGTYTLTFVPDDLETPPRVWTDVSFNLDTDPQLTIPARRLSVTGVIYDTLVPGFRSQAVPRARVVALTENGAGSTVAETDEAGFFRLFLLPQASVYDLRVVFENEALFREYTLRKALECGGTRCTNLLGEDDQFLVQLDAIMSNAKERQIRFRSSVPGVSLAGASVELASDFEWGTLRIRKVLDQMGEVRTALPSGSWTVLVTTSSDSRTGNLESTLDVQNDLPAYELDLPSRLQVNLDVTDGSIFFEDTRIEIRPLGRGEAQVVTTDASGRLSTQVDPKMAYRISVTPGVAGQPRSALIATAEELAEARSLLLPKATAIAGRVFGPPGSDDEWVPVGDVTIQAFDGTFGESVILGESNTREDGGFRMLIPVGPAILQSMED